MKRYAVKKWWSVVESDLGPYVSYDDAQAMIDRLRADRDKHRADNKLLWDQIAEQKKETSTSSNVIEELDKSYKKLDERYFGLRKSYDEAIKLAAKYLVMFVVALLALSVMVYREFVL